MNQTITFCGLNSSSGLMGFWVIFKLELKTHVEHFHEGKKPFQCTICWLCLTTKLSLKNHIDIVHEGIKPFECTVCNKPFSRKRELWKHVQTIHENNRPFECDSCDKKFVLKNLLKVTLFQNKVLHSLFDTNFWNLFTLCVFLL